MKYFVTSLASVCRLAVPPTHSRPPHPPKLVQAPTQEGRVCASGGSVPSQEQKPTRMIGFAKNHRRSEPKGTWSSLGATSLCKLLQKRRLGEGW